MRVIMRGKDTARPGLFIEVALPVKSIDEARREVRNFIERYQLKAPGYGSPVFDGADVKVASGRVIARISYTGEVSLLGPDGSVQHVEAADATA